MKGTLFRAIAIAAFAVLLACAAAQALKIEIDETVVSVTADVSPHALPARGNAPVDVSSITRIKTKDRSQAPALRKISFVFDENGAVETKGLPTCSMAKLAETTPPVARKRCAGAIVGEGVGKALVALPGARPVEISSPLTLFNAAPKGGDPSLIIHAYETLPTPKTVLVRSVVERVNQGRYGFRVEIEVPEIAAGYGSPTLAKATVGKTWKRGGKTVGYTNAHCDGGRLQVHGSLTLADGSFFPGTLTSPCHTAD